MLKIFNGIYDGANWDIGEAKQGKETDGKKVFRYGLKRPGIEFDLPYSIRI